MDDASVSIVEGEVWHELTFTSGVVHIIDGAHDSMPSAFGWMIFYARCRQKMKWKNDRTHAQQHGRNRMTKADVTCLACIAAR